MARKKQQPSVDQMQRELLGKLNQSFKAPPKPGLAPTKTKAKQLYKRQQDEQIAPLKRDLRRQMGKPNTTVLQPTKQKAVVQRRRDEARELKPLKDKLTKAMRDKPVEALPQTKSQAKRLYEVKQSAKDKGLEQHKDGLYYTPKKARRFLPDVQPHIVDPLTGKSTKETLRRATHKQDSTTAAGLKVLEQTTRPLHGVAGATDAAITGKSPAKAFVRGLQNKDKTTFSDVLKHAGAPKAVQSVAGFGLDVAADPTTYVTFGTGSIARKAAEHEAERNAVKGLTVKVGGEELPGVRKATGETIGRGARRVGETKPAQVVKGLASDVNPRMAPKGATREQADAATSAARTTRASVSRRIHETEQRAVALRKAIGNDDQKVVDAIEAGKIHELPGHLQAPAKVLQGHYKAIRDAEKRHGIKGGTVSEMSPVEVPKITANRRSQPKAYREQKAIAQAAAEHNRIAAIAPKAYVPHHTLKSLEERAPSETVGGSVGKRQIKPTSSMQREPGTLKLKRDAKPGVYSDDAVLSYLNRMSEGHRSVEQAKLNQRIAAEHGKPIAPGKGIEFDPETEGVFRQEGSDLSEITSKDELAKIAEHGARSAHDQGTYVVLNKGLVERAHKVARGSGAKSNVGKAYDKVQGGFKFIATQPNPGFHVRNLIGDTNNAFLAQPGQRLPANLRHSARALRALKHDEESLRELGKTGKQISGGVELPDGRKLSYHEVAKLAADHGAIRSGFTNRELSDLIKQAEGATKVKQTTRLGRAVKRTGQSREDLPRLSTFIEGLRKGMDPEEAARFSSEYHFDYGDLTEFERKYARRVAPFYTFSARNMPLQAKRVLTNPGKFAQYQKVREEAAKAFGYEDSYEKDLAPWEQRNLPVPVKVGGRKLTLSGGLPLTDLNEVPTTLNPAKQLSEWGDKAGSLVSPVIKDPVELWANYSTFFRGPIRRENSPLVAAPPGVEKLPKKMRDEFRVRQIIDKRTGKKVWAWDAKANYVMRAMTVGPVSSVLGLATPGSDRADRQTGEKLSSTLGLKATPFDPETTRIDQAYEDLGPLREKLGELSQAGIKGDNTNDERRALNEKQSALLKRIYELSEKRGDKVLPSSGKPKKSSSGWGGSSSSSSGWGPSKSSKSGWG